MDYQKIIDAVIDKDPSLPHELIYDNAGTSVYHVHTPTPLIVRVGKNDTGSYQFQAALLKECAGQDALTSQILYWETREIDNSPIGIQVQTFVPGKPISRYPAPEIAKSIVEGVFQLHTRMSAASTVIEVPDIPRIKDLITQLTPFVSECPIKTAAENLLQNQRYLELIAAPEECLIYGDLWYKNILIDNAENETTVRFIDIDPIVWGPPMLQPAIFFTSYFLFAALSLAPKDPAAFNLDDLLSAWPEPLNRTDILLLMQVYPVGLGLLKTVEIAQSDMDANERQSILAPFEQSIQIINQLMAA